MFKFVIFALLCLKATQQSNLFQNVQPEHKPPTVLVAFLVRNKALTLPYFLTCVERLNYPKSRISLWIRSDHNEDNSLLILNDWLVQARTYGYHSINYDVEEGHPARFPGELSPSHWTPDRYNHLIKLKEEALFTARHLWADFIFVLDCDALITDPDTLKVLISKQATIVAPMLMSGSFYSNFWAAITDDHYYKRSDDYAVIYKRDEVSCFNVPMVYSAVLTNLNHKISDKLSFEPSNFPTYKGSRDDLIMFGVGANLSGIPLLICNDRDYGFISVPLYQDEDISMDREYLTNLKVLSLESSKPLPVSESLAKYTSTPTSDFLGTSGVFVINLERRTERRQRMELTLQELGINATFTKAVDGRELTDDSLKEMGISVMAEFRDPFFKRQVTLGEVGCFLSHYHIWQEAFSSGLESVLVLEDDLLFKPFFRRRFQAMLDDLATLKGDWDLVYIGRKKLLEKDEPWVNGTKSLVHVDYSYWTLGYLLSHRGAKKLLRADPLKKLLPVDEFLPIMFDRHPEESWRNQFPVRDLKAFSVAPLLVHPTHYTGNDGYVSDTEDSSIIGKEASVDLGTKDEL